jgi:hypothetical protein
MQALAAILSTAQQGEAGATYELWANHMRYFNDPGEYRYAFDLALECAVEVRERGHSQTAAPAVDVIVEYLKQWAEYAVFIASFSAKRDDLSQWRGYCQGDEGYAIGFVPNEDAATTLAKNDFSLLPCVYDEAVQRAATHQLINEALEKWTGPADGQPFLDRFLRVAPMFKDQAFAGEEEWRIASRPARFEDIPHVPGAQYRASDSMAIPYRPVSIGSGERAVPISTILVGPKRYPDLAGRSIRGYLQSVGLGVNVEASSIPYRFM